MRFAKIFGCGVATLSMLAAGAVLAVPPSAQNTFDWISNGTGGTNQDWNVGTNWSPTGIPGTADTVNVVNNRIDDGALTAQQTEVVYITTDVGAVAAVNIGGVRGAAEPGGVAPPFGGGWTTIVAVRTNAGHIDIGNLTLGRVDVDDPSDPGAFPQQRAGQFNVNNAGSSATVGNVFGGSTSNANGIGIGNNVACGLTITGNIDALGGATGGANRLIDLLIQADNGT